MKERKKERKKYVEEDRIKDMKESKWERIRNDNETKEWKLWRKEKERKWKKRRIFTNKIIK